MVINKTTPFICNHMFLQLCAYMYTWTCVCDNDVKRRDRRMRVYWLKLGYFHFTSIIKTIKSSGVRIDNNHSHKMYRRLKKKTAYSPQVETDSRELRSYTFPLSTMNSINLYTIYPQAIYLISYWGWKIKWNAKCMWIDYSNTRIRYYLGCRQPQVMTTCSISC